MLYTANTCTTLLNQIYKKMKKKYKRNNVSTICTDLLCKYKHKTATLKEGSAEEFYFGAIKDKLNESAKFILSKYSSASIKREFIDEEYNNSELFCADAWLRYTTICMNHSISFVDE